MAAKLEEAWPWHHRSRDGCCWHRVWFGLLVAWILITAHVTLSTRGHLQHPALIKACYDYSQTTLLNNICCRLHNYTKKDASTCIQRATIDMPQLKRSGETYGILESVSTFRGKGWLWVFIGDSRMRQLFSTLVTMLSSPRLKYRKPSTGGKWRSVHELTENLRMGKLHEDIEVYHMDLQIQLLFYWDPLLVKLPKLLDQWTNNENQRPTLLVLGSCLHWMRATLPTYRSDGPKAAFDKFKQQMETVLPQLLDFAESTYTIVQLQDHVQESLIFEEYRGIYANSNIDRYNSFLATYLSGSSVAIWDSNVPLSDIYYAKCRQSYRKSYDVSWICDNPLHTGFVMVEVYANMLLNDVCNSFLGLDPIHC